MSARKKTSVVWNHFDEGLGKKARCVHCSKCISVAAGAIGNLFRHMRTLHPHIELVAEKWMPKPIMITGKPPSKKKTSVKNIKEESYFSLLKRYCVDLVQVHNRPTELFDDQAFQNIIMLVPIPAVEKHLISAKFIEDLIQNEEEWLGEENDYDDEKDGLYTPDGEKEEPERLNKKDLNDTDDVECTCDADKKHKKFHSSDCPALANQKYWAFFDVSIESAKCKVCYKRIKWSNMIELKTHLMENHSELKFKDDDEVFATESQHVVDSDRDSFITEEMFAEDYQQDVKIQLKPSTAKKRRKQSFEQEKPYITLTDSVNVDLERFVGLDRFGLYVAYLLRDLPSKKCVKFQEQIVLKLLREQAMAG